MSAQFGRISGPLLASNLLRDGVDLAFETDLLYLDVTNGRIGVNTDSPTRTLTVNGTTKTTNLIVDTQAELANFTISSNNIRDLLGTIYVQPNQSTDPIVATTKFQAGSLQVSNQLIKNITTDSDINFSPTGQTIFNTSRVNVNGTLHSTGNITFDGDITFGNANTDNVTFSSDVNSDLIPNADNTYNLGSLGQEWATLYSVNFKTTNIDISGLTANGINLLQTAGKTLYVSINGDDTYYGTHQHSTFRTVKYALSQATSGDTVIIFPGTYEEEFPLTVPAGVTVKGAGIRAVSIEPTAGTNTENAFLLNGDTTVEFLTVQNFYYDSINNTGYGFAFAPSYKATSRSPYVYNVTVITSESVVISYTENYSLANSDWTDGFFYAQPNANIISLNTDLAQPSFYSVFDTTPAGTVFQVTYNDNTVDTLTQTGSSSYFGSQLNVPVTGFSSGSIKLIKAISWGQVSTPQGDAGGGAYLDGSVADPTGTLPPTGLFFAATFITPNQDGITGTNGVRIEWLNSFTYFAKRGIYLTEGTLGRASQGTVFGAEMRSINSANVYGTHGAVADGPNTLAYLIGHNFGYIGTGTDSTNDPQLVIQANEVEELNNGVIYYDSQDHKGDFRIGNIFWVEQSTGNVTFDANSINFGSLGSITLEGPSSTTIINKDYVQTGNIRVHDNTIESLIGPVQFLSASGKTYLNTNVYVTGNTSITGDGKVTGNVYLGNNPLDVITIYPLLTQHLLPDDVGGPYNLGSTGKRWNTLFATLLDVDGITQIYNNEITTLTSGTDLQLTAAGTGKLYVANDDVAFDQELTIDGTFTVNGLSTLQDLTIDGTVTQTGNFNQTGASNAYITGLFANNNIDITGTSYIAVPDVKIFNNEISATATNSDLNFVGIGTGGVVLDNRLTIKDNIISNTWSGATTDTQKSIIFSPNGTGNTVINSTKSLVLPVGNSTTRNISAIGEVRFNNNSNMVEAYSPSGRVNFMNIWDSDRNTYITPELTPGANDNTIRFGINGTVKATITAATLFTNTVHIDNVNISGNTLNNLVTSNDLEFLTPGSGNVVINSTGFNTDSIINTTNGPLTLASTGLGYVKFDGTGAVRLPIGPSTDRRAFPEVGEMRNNTTVGYMEVFCGDTNQGDNGWIPAIGTSGAATLNQVNDIMDVWTLILG